MAKRKSGKKYTLPFRNDGTVKISAAPAHTKRANLHHCIDFAMPEDTPVLASRAGIVSVCESKYTKTYFSSRYKKRGNRVVIEHEDGETSVYIHLKHRSLKVKRSQKVRTGQVIGLSGQTGYATYSHLHFGIYNKGGKNVRVNFSDQVERITLQAAESTPGGILWLRRRYGSFKVLRD